MSQLLPIKNAGFTLVELIIVSALSVIIFGALFGSLKYSLDLVSASRAKLSALAVANDRMEYFRSLPYNDIGTILGIPPGTIPQNSTTSLNGIEFTEKVLVEYVDDAADGQGAADANGIPSDYKRVKLMYTWEIRGETYNIISVSDIMPRSVETTAGGGTVRINVIDANSALLQGATVRLFNDGLVPQIDVTRVTDASGAALFSGAPAGSDYQVEVTANIGGHVYSTDKTYIATTSNPNPLVAPFSVLESDVSTLTFQISELSDLDIVTRSVVNENVFQETFADLLAVASSSQVAAGGDLVLMDNFGVYETSGFAYLGPITPTPLQAWQVVRVAADIPANTLYRVQFYTGATPGPFTLIPDGDLPGNATGFSDTIFDISALDPITYPTIYVGITLETTNSSVTPELDEVSVFYRESENVLSNTAFSIRGNKIIGTDAAMQPIYKYSVSTSTDASGELTVVDLESDTYTLNFGGYDIARSCPAHPYVHRGGEHGKTELLLVADTANTVRVSVFDTLGRAIPGAAVHITRAGYNTTILTDVCGQAFFTGGVTPDSDYTIGVSATGYVSYNASSFTVGGDTVTTVILSQ